MNGQDLKNSILQLAIQGKLVPQDPNDEPASELLAKIRKEKEQLVKEKKLKKKDLVTTPISDEDKPFEIPESWEWCRLGEIVVLLSGQDLTPNRYFDSEKGIPYITGASHFVNGSLKVSRWTDSPTSVSHLGDLLITCKGTVGTMAYNTIGDIHIARQIMAITPILTFLPYVQHYLCNIVPKLEKLAHSIIPGISREVLLSSIIPLPPLSEQQRIVAKIDELMPLVEKYDKAQTKLDKLNSELPEQLKQSILQEAIMGKLGTQDLNDEPASELLKRIRAEKEQLVKEKKIKKEKALPEISDEEKPFEIPDNWVWCRLGEVFNVNMGQSPDGNTINEIGGTEFHQGKMAFTDIIIGDSCVYTTDSKKMASNGDLLVCVRAPIGNVNICNRDISIGRGLCALRPHLEMNIKLWFYFIAAIKSELESKGTGSTFKAISGEILKRQVIPLPPLAEQHRIVEKLDKLMHKIDKLKK